jgi:hypothetical protein
MTAAKRRLPSGWVRLLVLLTAARFMDTVFFRHLKYSPVRRPANCAAA